MGEQGELRGTKPFLADLNGKLAGFELFSYDNCHMAQIEDIIKC